MGKVLALGGFALALSLFVVQNAAGQTATSTPTVSSPTATPTPTGSGDATVPSGAPATGYGSL